MESLQSIKLRRKGIHNINQITKAMELVAATKMRRSQEIALASRPYVFAALDLLSTITRMGNGKLILPPLLQAREVKTTAYVVITSDKGLAGSFNSAVLRTFDKYVRQNPISKENDRFIGIGQKAAMHLEKNAALSEKFIRVGDYTTIEQVTPIVDLLIKGFLDGTWDRVIVFSTHFRTALRQEVLVREILPVTFEKLWESAQSIVPETGKFAELVKEHQIPLFNTSDSSATKLATGEAPDYIVEPNPEVVIEGLARHLVIMELYHIILEANASEHAARRMAMKSASDNAKELAEELAIQYNKSRQAVITREILEITAGAESLK